MTPQALQAWHSDEVLRWREAINKDHVRQRIIEKKNMVEWANWKDYDRPTKEIKGRKKFRLSLRFLLP